METDIKEYFTFAVYDTVRSIPKGKVTTYGAIARAVGFPNMSRLVGKVMSTCTDAAVPAHRVVNAGGKLPAVHFSDDSRLKKMLEAEGMTVVDGRIKHWEKVLWDPVEDISL